MASIRYISKYVALPGAGRGGTRSYMLMREMARAGHECVIVTSDSNHLTNVPHLNGPTLVETVDGVTVCWLRTRKFQRAQSLGRILSWLDFEWRLFRMPRRLCPRPEVVIVSSLSLLTIFNGLWLRRRYGCRLVFEVRDIWPLTIVEEGGFSPRNPLVLALGWVEKLAYRRADAVVGTMPNLRQHVDGLLDRHAPVHEIGFGIDPDAVPGDGDEPVSADWIATHIPEGKFIVCHAGTIGITNALDTLFACAGQMAGRSDIYFLIVGEGDLRAHYERLYGDLPNVGFTGPVRKSAVRSVIDRCDLVYFSTHPSRVWDYGISLNKLIDYMQSGKPIVGSYSGYPTMVEASGAGSVVAAGDPLALEAAIARYAAMPAAQRAAIGARGPAWLLAHRRYDRLAADYLDIALGGTPRTARADAGQEVCV
jgi:glycosyltransferase involved in cell wall biosynthesis